MALVVANGEEITAHSGTGLQEAPKIGAMAEPTQDRNKPVGASGGLDARQRQIKEGAGLDESRVNQEFVEFLRVWLPWILGAIALVLGGWVGWQRWTQHKHQVIAQAFADYDAAVMPASSGLDLDEEHGGKA